MLSFLVYVIRILSYVKIKLNYYITTLAVHQSVAGRLCYFHPEKQKPTV